MRRTVIGACLLYADSFRRNKKLSYTSYNAFLQTACSYSLVNYCYNAFLLTENISGMMTVIDRMSQTSALHTLQNWRQSHNRHGARVPRNVSVQLVISQEAHMGPLDPRLKTLSVKIVQSAPY